MSCQQNDTSDIPVNNCNEFARDVCLDIAAELCDEFPDIVIDKANIQYAIVDDDSSNGGLLDDAERKLIYKGKPARSSQFRNQMHERRGGRQATSDAALTVFFDKLGRVYFIHLQNFLPPKVLESRTEIRNRLREKLRRGWAKTCGLSQHTVLSRSAQSIQCNKYCRLGYFGRFENEYSRRIEIVAGADGKGGTGRATYINRKNQIKTYQIGNFIERCVEETNSSKFGPNGNTYLTFSVRVLRAIGDFVEFPRDRISSDKHVPKSHRSTTTMNCSVALNHALNGCPTAWAIHDDATVTGACVTSAEHDPKFGLLSSTKHNTTASGGELWHELGGLIHGYDPTDLVLFNGLHYHAPLMPTPINNRGKVGRYSYVVYRN